MEEQAKSGDTHGAAGSRFESLNRRKTHEEVAERIRERIVGGRLKVGERLPTERELAEQFGVSRSALREALRALELVGLVRVKKGAKGGIFVTQDYDRPIADSILNLLAGGWASLENLFELRELIEPYAASRAAVLGTEEDFGELSRLLEAAEQTGREHGVVRPLNVSFHHKVIQMSRNPVMVAVADTVLSILSQRTLHLSRPDRSVRHLNMHREMLDAIRRRDSGAARMLMSQDIHSMRMDFMDAGQQ